ncbi:helix-turn-helix domain-containing protein [Alphaproteobacteria bacterium]|nr:helix-turn-helix domain-containing protein [Alphaproteobacteria bacterium]
MINSFVIKEARESQKISQEQLAKKLRLRVDLIKDIENGKSLKGIDYYYEKSYIRSIYKVLNLNLNEKIQITNVNFENNYRILIIIYFLIFFIFSSLSLSHYIFTKFSGNLEDLKFINNYQEDSIATLLSNKFEYSDTTFIDDNIFLKSLKFLNYSKYNIFFEIKIKQESEAYYKLYYPRKNIEKYGELKNNNKLSIKKIDKFYLNFSNISAIDYIIFNGKKYHSMIANKGYLKNFNIFRLYNLK